MSMSNCMKALINFHQNEDGPTAVEYAIMLALIIVVCLTAIGSVGTQSSAIWNDSANQLSNAINP